MSQERGRAAGTNREPGPEVAATTRPTTVIMTRRGDGLRARRLRCMWSRLLDEHLGLVDPWTYAEPVGDPYHDLWLDRGVPERDRAGADLAAAGWCP